MTQNVNSNKNLNAIFYLNDLKINSIGNYNILINYVPKTGQNLNIANYNLKITPKEGYNNLKAYIFDLFL